MGKTLTAAQMLSAGRKRPPTPAETGTERLDDVVTSAPGDQTSKPLDNQTPAPLDDVVTSAPGDQTSNSSNGELAGSDQRSKRLSDFSSEVGDETAATYQRMTVFLTPAQRQWLKLTGKQLPDGLSISDIVRLAVSRLSLDVTDGLNLVANLTDQAHADAEIFSGRRNRGLPPRVQSTLG